MSAPKRPKQNRSRGLRGWTIDTVRTAVEAQLKGQLRDVTQLARSMMLDETYSGAIDKRVNGLVRSELLMDGEDDDVDSLSKVINRMLPEDEVSRFLTHYHNVGTAVGFLSVENVDGQWVPRLNTLNPEFLTWSYTTGCWEYSAENGIMPVTPGDGVWVLMSSWANGEPAGYVSRLGESWARKGYALRMWADWCREAADPINVGTTPADADPDAVDAFMADLVDLSETRAMALPEGYDVRSHVKAGDWTGLKDIVEREDRKMLISVLGGNLSTEMTAGGSYSAAQVHRGIEKDLIDSDIQRLSTVVRDQITAHWAAWNAKSSTPWISWSTDEPEDVSANIAALTSLAAVLKGMNEAGFEVTNVAELAQRLGAELKRKVQ